MVQEHGDLGGQVVVVEETVGDVQHGEVIIEELVVIEEYAQRGETPPRARLYRVRIDKGPYEFANPDPTGEQILEQAKKTSAGWKLYQVFRGHQPVPVAPTDHVNLRAPGVERFVTVPKDPTEGTHDTRTTA